MGKKKRAELERQKQSFISGAVKNGISKEVAAGIFLKIEPLQNMDLIKVMLQLMQ